MSLMLLAGVAVPSGSDSAVSSVPDDWRFRFFPDEGLGARAPAPFTAELAVLAATAGVLAGVPGVEDGVPGVEDGVPGVEDGVPGVLAGAPGLLAGAPGVLDGAPRVLPLPVVVAAAGLESVEPVDSTACLG